MPFCTIRQGVFADGSARLRRRDVRLGLAAQKPLLRGPRGDLGAVGHARLVQEIVHVLCHRERAQQQPLRDLPVREATRHEPEHLDLAVSQPPDGFVEPVEDRKQTPKDCVGWTLDEGALPWNEALHIKRLGSGEQRRA